MGDYQLNAAAGDDQQSPNTAKSVPFDVNANVNPAFQAQLDHLSQAQIHDVSSYGQPQSFNMGSMAHALPHTPHSPMSPQGHFGSNLAHGAHPSHGMHHMLQQGYPGGRMDPIAIARAQQMQQAQFMYPPYATLSSPRQSLPQMQLPTQYNAPDFYGYAGSPRHPPAMDPRFAQAAALNMVPGPSGDVSQYARRASEPAAIPSYPRGPPRKPKQSGHALWVGNLPPAAQIGDLKDHFSRDATKDIESLFLISKSNCAFVNYRSEKACADAMSRFHDSRFQGVRLVCRLRRSTGTSSTAGAESATAVEEETESGTSSASPSKQEASGLPPDPESPTIVKGSYGPDTAQKPIDTNDDNQTSSRVSERYFIVKSLTVQDLESSTRTGIWATQNHNESLFNDAYQNTDNVYLIFSANKSGEYFGYARMASNIEGQPVNLNARGATSEPPYSGTPQAIETPATATAPKGRIIDDSARGTIFWEAVQGYDEDVEEGSKEGEEGGAESTPGSNWGRQFNIEWISTARLPFYRTRGLRNPWNNNQEVKIARDGTELEPSIGRRLVQMFHRPPPGPNPQQYAMQYR